MKSCVRIPDNIRQELFRLRRRGIIFKTSPEGGGKKYWGQAIAKLGVVETAGEGLRFAPGVLAAEGDHTEAVNGGERSTQEEDDEE